jgi:hypothetical protein
LLVILLKLLQLYKFLCFCLCLYFCPPHAQICAASKATRVLKMPPPATKKPNIPRGAQGTWLRRLTHKAFGQCKKSSKCFGGEGSKTTRPPLF